MYYQITDKGIEPVTWRYGDKRCTEAVHTAVMLINVFTRGSSYVTSDKRSSEINIGNEEHSLVYLASFELLSHYLPYMKHDGLKRKKMQGSHSTGRRKCLSLKAQEI